MRACVGGELAGTAEMLAAEEEAAELHTSTKQTVRRNMFGGGTPGGRRGRGGTNYLPL